MPSSSGPRRRFARAAGVIVVCAAITGCASSGRGVRGAQTSAARPDGPQPPSLAEAASSDRARGRYAIIERTLAVRAAPANPWDVPVMVTLTSPAGAKTKIGGFYTGFGAWKFRFAPPQAGTWRWRATAVVPGRVESFTGSFRASGPRSAGYVHRSSVNPYLWTAENGSPYYPLGLQTCLVDAYESGGPFVFALDGGPRPGGGIVLPGQKQILQGAGAKLVNLDTYIGTYARAGFNLYRWSVDNCSFNLYQTISPAGNVYGAQTGRWGDQLVRTLRRYGVRVDMVFFSFGPPRDSGPAQMAAIKRYLGYVVARYGAYVDYWELANETVMSTTWYTQLLSYLRSVDPYHHPISTSYAPPDLSLFDYSTPHWYESEPELTSDQDAAQRFAGWKSAGKPVMVGEQGNSGRNWDPTSSVRMRLRIWAAFFSQGSIIFWNQDAFQDQTGASADIWLGPQERQYASVLSRYDAGFDPHARTVFPSLTDTGQVRGYELTGPRELGLYLTNYTSHSAVTHGVVATVSPAFAGTATWISPASGGVLGTTSVKAGLNRLTVPDFTTDIALKVVP